MPSTRPLSGGSAESSVTRNSPNTGAASSTSTWTPIQPPIALKPPRASASTFSAAGAEDQIAIRGRTTFVPRLRPCSGLTRPFPTKLTPDATYVVTGGAGALGRVVATYLAERGARHITLLSRSAIPPRSRWPALTEDDPHFATVTTIRAIERLGVRITTASVDVADVEQVTAWLSKHIREGGRPVRGIVHAAGSVNDQLLVNTSEVDFAKVMAPKVTGTRVLHDAFRRP